ncbi:hypothetical protein K2X05_14285 [bacterium]|nr:hypothetical protein [bacterium]
MTQFFTKWKWRNRFLEFIYCFYTITFATLFLIQVKLWKFEDFTRQYCPKMNLRIEQVRLDCELDYMREHILFFVLLLPLIMGLDIFLRRLFIRKLFLTY